MTGGNPSMIKVLSFNIRYGPVSYLSFADSRQPG
jgi:hypothetical protein